MSESVRTFLHEDFLLFNETARRLYHEYAESLPIVDYHTHLDAGRIASNRAFENLTRLWLDGDHYKWRAMRTQGVPEDYCTGSADDREKFLRWASAVPFAVRNPLYHWAHLELWRYFGVDVLLNRETAPRIYELCNERLSAASHLPLGLLSRTKVELLCTTDDPVDSLEDHRRIAAAGLSPRVLPSFRPDRALAVDRPADFNAYVEILERVSQVGIDSYGAYLEALKKRHDFFAEHGCRVSDHGLEQMPAEDFTEPEAAAVFAKVRSGRPPDRREALTLRSALSAELAEWDWEKGWVQQFHLGALRNANPRLVREIGPDTGWDAIGDLPQAGALAKFLGRLDRRDRLAKTILFNINPAANEVMATMIGCFNDGRLAGKIQWGPAWWFLDQKEGMIRHLNALSNMGLVSRFVGMAGDSRSLLSFSRHEYFRRILCQLFGEEVERGELPSDLALLGSIIQDICYHNACRYFPWDPPLR